MENKLAVEKIVNEYIRKIYGFALNRVSSLQDAEDLTQEISLKLYKTLIADYDIVSIDAYVWRICHNMLANYYRSKCRSFIGISFDDISESVKVDDKQPDESLIEAEAISKLEAEIAYLSKIQRQVIILYYYSGKKQEEISLLLDIPKGTVKWHLFEAKAELKKGMEFMRNVSELKFNPVKFDAMGVSGSIGTMGSTENFFRSSLSQNIAYCVYRVARTINEIADLLGVSPAYVESEVEFLEEYSFLFKKPGNKYIANILIDEPNEKVNAMLSDIYESAAKLIANEVFDELYKSEIIKGDRVYCPQGDKNFLMWSLVFYVLAFSETDEEDRISFEEAATIRKDGGQNIPSVSIIDPLIHQRKYSESIKKWCGPMWNGTEKLVLWQIETEWSNRNLNVDVYARQAERDLKLLERFIEGDLLSKDEYAYMAEQGYITGANNIFALSIVWIKDKETKLKLQAIGSEVKIRYKNELKQLREKFVKLVLADTPKHLHKMRNFGLQFAFRADGWFLLHSAMELLQNGRLTIVSEEKRKALTTMIISD